MNKVSTFKKVSFNEFKNGYYSLGYTQYLDSELMDLYDNINIPIRKTACSAGHDIMMPFDIKIPSGGKIIIPTGIRCKMEENYVMLIFPRSSFGIKKGMFISNTIPVIDADYYYADNEGHIFMAIENQGNGELNIKAGEAFCQAVFVQYGVADEEEIINKRTGGIGSTSKE